MIDPARVTLAPKVSFVRSSIVSMASSFLSRRRSYVYTTVKWYRPSIAQN
jgi:hypothetical protein